MNPSINHSALRHVTLLTLVVPYLSCSHPSTNPSDSRPLLSGISDITNIIWTLDESGYAPFHLIYSLGHFFGDDGCNRFGGAYEARNDSVFPTDVAQTQQLCSVNAFPLQYLAEPYRIHITRSGLRIFTQEGIFTYRTDVADDIEDSPLIQCWVLAASTDPAFAEIQTSQPTPTLLFDRNRGFRLAWSRADINSLGYDEVFGIFGTGAGNRILFYKTGWRRYAQRYDLMERILNSSSYSVNPDTLKAPVLILLNESYGSRFEFKTIKTMSTPSQQ